MMVATLRAPWFLSRIEKGGGILSRSPPKFVASIKDSVPFAAASATTQPQTTSTPSSPSGSSSKISPAVLFVIVILAVLFFISGLLHLLVRFLIKKRRPFSSSSPDANGRTAVEISGSDALQRQLQQLFHLHDSGLDQAFIDALPVFLYKEIVGSKEPFDCAVCLCEFANEDKLRLLPLCGHAFHIHCIDTWLLSNSTCPLCRGVLFAQGLTVENPIFDFEDFREEQRFSRERELEGNEVEGEKRVFPVKLGKLKNLGTDGDDCGENDGVGGTVRREEGECSSSSLDARRCFSMGSYQYVVADAKLQVSLNSGSIRNVCAKVANANAREFIGHSSGNEVFDGKRLGLGSRGESFSVSKIWQWSNKKGKFPVPSETSSLDGAFPWFTKAVGSTDT